MNFLHWDGWVGPDDVIVVTLDRAANVQLVDDCAFAAYRSGLSYSYRGGHYRHSPVRMRPAHHGHWHVVVDLGGYGGTVQVGVRVLTAVA
jgi:Domain of unknown function (DUF1883)